MLVTTSSPSNSFSQAMLYTRPSSRRAALPCEEILVDNFAGGGGASTGIELALGRSVDVAINHDRDAIKMHEANHPNTEHYQEDVWKVDPKKAACGRPVGLAWFSPDCKHHSRARGYKPVDKKIRGLAWVAVRWAKSVRPRIICLENVSEFQEWGPVIPYVVDGKVQFDRLNQIKYVPDPRRKGITFKRFVTTLRNLGYQVEWKILNAAEYGAPTIRRRLFLIARCDGRPIVWPEPTHGKPGSLAVTTGALKPFRMAAECIDFSREIRSIFDRPKDLADNTLRRVAVGLGRFVIDSEHPFIIEVEVPNAAKGKSKQRKVKALMAPYITRICQTGSNGNNVSGVTRPLSTIVTKNEHCLIAPILVGAGGPRHSGKPQRADRPTGVIMPENHRALAAAFLVKFYGTAIGADVRKPMPTITSQAGGGHMAEVRALMTKYTGNNDNSDDPIVVMVDGEPYVVIDIGLRMLTPRELAYAQFGWDETDGRERAIAEDYELTGTQANQVAKIGNSVPPLVAAAIVRANMFDAVDEELSKAA